MSLRIAASPFSAASTALTTPNATAAPFTVSAGTTTAPPPTGKAGGVHQRTAAARQAMLQAQEAGQSSGAFASDVLAAFHAYGARQGGG
jgi:hypothetical protein